MSFVEVDDSDPRIQYSDGWAISRPEYAFAGTLHAAQTAGLTATFKFTGTWVTVLGCGGDTAHTGFPSTAYAIDGTRYKVLTPDPATASRDTLFYNVTFFTSPDLAPGPHTLVITNLNGTAPNLFLLDWIRFQATDFEILPTASGSLAASQSHSTSIGTVPSGTSDTGSASATPSLQATSSNPIFTLSTTGLSASDAAPTESAGGAGTSSSNVSSKSQNLGAIIGGTIGGIVFIAGFAILAVYLFFKHKYARQDDGALHKIQREKGQGGQLGRSRTLFRVSAPPPSSTTPSGTLPPTAAGAEAAVLLPYSASAPALHSASSPPGSQGPSTDAFMSTSEPARSGVFRFRSMRKERFESPTPTMTPGGSQYDAAGEYGSPFTMQHELPPETVLSSPPAYTPD